MKSDPNLTLQAYFGELLMVWRLYVIWSRNRRVLYLPAVLATLGAVGCILIIVYDVLGGRWATDPGFMVQYKMISVAVFAITIVATWYSTILICYRLYLVDREMHALRETGPGSPSHRYARIMRVLVQSGLLYSVTLGAWLIATVTGNTSAQDMIRYLNIRAVGLNSTLIVLRLPMHHKNQMVDIGMRTIDMDQQKVSIGELPPEPQLSPSAVHLDRIRQESSTQIEEMA
ncbi:hypothetical protein FRB98_002021 [Tulasnella sp. 332]|nr:hypothetical protein FRB98_002021 [Tulasnella sp. 332]